MSRPHVIGNARAVLPDRVLPDAVVEIADGRIAAIRRGTPPPGALDAGGQLLVPGLIDLHTDAWERALRPRPGVTLPVDYAFHAMERDLLAGGITTVFHGVGLQHATPDGRPHDLDEACSMIEWLQQRRPDAAADHRVLHRLSVRSPEGVDAYARLMAAAASEPALVSHEDHTPGQGQYADRAQLAKLLIGQGFTQRDADLRVAELEAEGQRNVGVRTRALRLLAEHAASGRIRLLGHDLDSPAAVDEMAAHGTIAAEFPLGLAAAAHARARGLLVVCGAPNAIRGSSHNGNASTRDLVARGLVDALTSDYVPNSVLGAAWTLHRLGLVGVPAAIALVTSGPAAVAGLSDRGRLEVGLRADLALIDDVGPWPRVMWTRR